MSYVGSYCWRIRQKVGHDLLVVPAVETICERDGKILMVYHKEFEAWSFPGGSVEDDGMTWQDGAARELVEETGITVDPKKLIPFGAASGKDSLIQYKNGDKVQVFAMAFIAREFINEVDDLDETEIAEKKWFTIDEVEKLDLSPGARWFFPAYKKYLETGEFQMIGESL